MSIEKIKVAIYTRVSTGKQAEGGLSLAAQERELRKYCKRNDYTIYKVYSDEGISAKDIRHRPAMNLMLNDARSGCFNIILVWKLSRFSRKLSDLITTCEELERHNVFLVSCTEGFDCTTPTGRMLRDMLGVVSQFEREIVAENVRLCLLERAEQGKRTTNHVLGYDLLGKDQLVINTKEAEYVEFCFKEYLKRKNLSEVAAVARKRGYKGKRNGLPEPWSINVIITRPVYAGYNVLNETLYRGSHEPIVTVSVYNRAQDLLKQQGRLYGRKRLTPLRKIQRK